MLIASVVELGLQVVVLSGIVWVVTGTLNLAFLIAAVAMIMRFAEPMAMFISYTSVVELIASALQRIEQFMAIAPLPVAEQSEMPERYDIRFDNVSYRYEEGDGHALNHVSLTFPAASMSALVGASGAGKTTVTKLLMRYADPQQGQISIGGVDIRRLTPEQLNSLISVVFQDVWLFDDTLLAVVMTLMMAPGHLLLQILQCLVIVQSISLACALVCLYATLMSLASPLQAGVDFTLCQCTDAAIAILAGVIGGVVAQHFGYAACFLFAGAFTLLAAWVAYIRLHSARELMTSAID